MSIKSNYQKKTNATRKCFGLRIPKKAKTAFNLQVASSSSKMSHFQKWGTTKIYQFLTVVIAAVVLASCQKEVNNPVPGNSATSSTTSSAVTLKTMYWTVGGVKRQATVYIPSTTGYHPIVFGFHGGGGTGAGFGPKYCFFEKNWSNAIVVYPSALIISGKTKWQGTVGQTISGVQDADLKFFDAMLSTFVNNYNANSAQVFCHGWSSGGTFIYNVLWTKRGTKLKAISAAGAALGTTSGKNALRAMQVAGTHDPVCSFTRQQSTSQAIRNLDKCSSTGSTWATGPYNTVATHYSSSINDPVIFLKYDGNHTYPDNVPPLIVKFFQQTVSNTLH